jgi:hypothetical protein
MTEDLRQRIKEITERGKQSHGYYKASIDLQGLQTEAQVDAAESARKSVFWMAVSVAILMLASVASFALDLLTYWRGGG